MNTADTKRTANVFVLYLRYYIWKAGQIILFTTFASMTCYAEVIALLILKLIPWQTGYIVYALPIILVSWAALSLVGFVFILLQPDLKKIDEFIPRLSMPRENRLKRFLLLGAVIFLALHLLTTVFLFSL